MQNARKNRKGHLSKKRAEPCFNRLIATEIKREEKNTRQELGLNSESSNPSFSPSNSPIPEHWSAPQYVESHPCSSRTPSSILNDSDYYCPCDIKHPDD
jgi:hypothetical protein